jgi:hypothetical protein
VENRIGIKISFLGEKKIPKNQGLTEDESMAKQPLSAPRD